MLLLCFDWIVRIGNFCMLRRVTSTRTSLPTETANENVKEMKNKKIFDVLSEHFECFSTKKRKIKKSSNLVLYFLV